eukprot:COSAG02_NODE_1094_length_14603_cov_40.760549_10_plen_63_part_00
MAKFAQTRGKRIILTRMTPFDHEFDELHARVLIGLNKLGEPWMVGEVMPADLPDKIVAGMGL